MEGSFTGMGGFLGRFRRGGFCFRGGGEDRWENGE